MKQIRVPQGAGLDNLEIVDVEQPAAPGPGEIKVRVKASSLNYHDLAVVSGMMPPEAGRVPMADGAGVVEEVGEGVTEFAVGDAVVSCFFPQWQAGAAEVGDFSLTPGDGVDGFAQEYVVRPASAFTRAPRNYSFMEAATLTTAGLTAWRALVVEGQIKAGDTVLLLGTGGVSILALQFAKSMGATVIVTSSSDEKLERVKGLGADHLINYRRHPEWSEQVLECTGGRGVDHVVEVGGPATLQQSIRSCRVGGGIYLIGVLTGFDGAIPTAELMMRQQRLQGIVVGSRKQQQDMIAAIEANQIHPVIDAVYSLDEIAKAFELQQSAKHFGKICLDYTK